MENLNVLVYHILRCYDNGLASEIQAHILARTTSIAVQQNYDQS